MNFSYFDDGATYDEEELSSLMGGQLDLEWELSDTCTDCIANVYLVPVQKKLFDLVWSEESFDNYLDDEPESILVRSSYDINNLILTINLPDKFALLEYSWKVMFIPAESDPIHPNSSLTATDDTSSDQFTDTAMGPSYFEVLPSYGSSMSTQWMYGGDDEPNDDGNTVLLVLLVGFGVLALLAIGLIIILV
ncbi:hypothetical protein ADUPG1_011134 [Aduncisulcus paluster]|uniref:Uncharacterized protein n=2 Tax=Aduncisulcus paluster TaxID=2918883 RepID=A0ABQ5JXX5_9EUKA|nr:hypothetical protein ADUPG1_011134 [Aduncisulcus paluster]